MKTNNLKIQDRLRDVKPFWYLLAGALLMSLAHLSFNIDLLAWVAMVPFLIYLTVTKGWKSRVLFGITLFLTWSVIVAKIITHPIPIFLIPLYSIPLALFHLPGYLLYSKFNKQTWSIFIFPATMIVFEWVQFSFTPFGSWGAAAYTQANSLAILQSLSLFGMAGLSFMIYWINASLARFLLSGKWTRKLSIPLLITAVLVLFGSLRYDVGNSKAKDTLSIAAIGTDSEIGGLPLPSIESNEKVIRDILERSSSAAEAGAQIVVWTEAAFFLMKDNEQQWLDSISLLSKRNNVSIFASYVVPLSESPFHYENKFQVFNPDGSIEFEYFKHEPVAGEPAVKGTGALQTVEIAGAKIGGAICYDYDFPYLAKGNSKAGADIVALPSSDWRGIDPLHTEMAAYRAIEQGHSILRSTRFGLSAAITPYGDMISKMSSFDQNNKIMMAQLPVKGIRTMYSFIGDLLVYFSIGFLVFAIFIPVFSRRGRFPLVAVRKIDLQLVRHYPERYDNKP